MDGNVMAQAMAAMGWDPNAAIPMADAENQALMKEVDELFAQRVTVKESLQEVDGRLVKFEEHMKNCNTSIRTNTKLLCTHKNDLDKESHLFKLAEGELCKLKTDLRQKEKDIEELAKFIETTERDLQKRQCHVDKMIGRIQWAKTAMVEWRESMDAGRKGYELIEKYFKQDELRAREKDQRRQILQNEIDKLRRKLVEMYDEQRSLEQCLQCTAGLYRTAHAERRQMVETWKTSVNHMTAREREIAKKEIALHDLEKEAKAKDKERRDYDNQLNEIIENNRNVELAIEELNSETSEIKEEIQKLIDLAILKENEMDILQKELQNLSNRVLIQRAENRQNEQLKNEKLTELANFDQVLQKLIQMQASMQTQTMSSQQRLQMLEDMMDSEEKQQDRISRDTTAVNNFMYRSREQLNKLKDEKKVLDMANKGIRVTTAAIRHSTQEEEKELKRMTELHYNLAFKLLEIERRILKLEGRSVDPEVEQKTLQHLQHLERMHVKVERRLQATESENTKLDDNMRKLTIVYNEDSKKLEAINFNIKQAQVYCEGGVKRVKQESERYKNLTVELSLLRMRASIFEEEIEACDESSYNLEKHRLRLTRTIKDRMVEIKSQMDLLILKRKHYAEEKSTLRADIGERNKYLESVRARFELTAKLLGENEDGTLVTATQLKVETAQEKQLLLEEGNELNEQVMNAEKEVQALENTLLVFNRSNDTYRKSFKEFETDDEATRELHNLNETYNKALECLRNMRNRLFELQTDTETAANENEQLQSKWDVHNRNKLDDMEALARLRRELADQEGKLQRAEREMKLALKSVKQRPISQEFLRVFDMDLELRELDSRNLNVVNQLGDIAETLDDLGMKIVKLLIDHEIKLPHQLQKTISSSSWRSDYSDLVGGDGYTDENLSSERSTTYLDGESSSVNTSRFHETEDLTDRSGTSRSKKKPHPGLCSVSASSSPQLSVVSLRLGDDFDVSKATSCRNRMLRENVVPTITTIKTETLPPVCQSISQRSKCSRKGKR